MSLSSKLVQGCLVVAKVQLRANDDEGDFRAEVHDLGIPFGRDIFERHGIYNRKANKENVSVCVRQRSETFVLGSRVPIIFLLTSCIPQAELNVFVSSRKIDNVVILFVSGEHTKTVGM